MFAPAVSVGGVTARPAAVPRRPRQNQSDRRIPPPRRALTTRLPALSQSAPAEATSSRTRKGRASDFRHPLDQQNTQLLEALPGISQLTKSLITPVAERMLILEQISTSVLVSAKQLPHIHQMVLDAATALDVTPPQLYIRQNPTPNAYTLAISGETPVVVVHTALVELMTAAELQAVIGHELGHLKCDHGVWLTVANLLTLGVEVTPLIPRFVVQNVQDELLRWSRAAELSCDRAALVVAGDPKVIMSVLMKLSGGTPKLASQLNVDAFLDQARAFDEESNSALGYFLRNAQTRQLTHPLPVARAREIDLWSRSTEFQNFVEDKVFVAAPAGARDAQEAAAGAKLPHGVSSLEDTTEGSPLTSYDER